MKKNRIIKDWLEKYGTKEVEEQVKSERGDKSPLVDVKLIKE